MQYRAYVLTDDGHIRTPATIITAPNKQEAVEEASYLLNGTVVEIWAEDRLVARLDPPAPVPQAER
jgi:hypothetical protein